MALDDDAVVEIVLALQLGRHPEVGHPRHSLFDTQHLIALGVHPDASFHHDRERPGEAVFVAPRIFGDFPFAFRLRRSEVDDQRRAIFAFAESARHERVLGPVSRQEECQRFR